MAFTMSSSERLVLSYVPSTVVRTMISSSWSKISQACITGLNTRLIQPLDDVV